MKLFYSLVLALAIWLCAPAAYAADTAVDLSKVANDTWCGINLINCSTFPSGSQTYNDLPFDIPNSNNAWFAYEAAGGGSGTVSVTIPVNVKDVKTVYTLMNTIWGSKTKGLLTFEFTGTGGATWTFSPVEGTDTRDYNNGNYVNSIDCNLPSGAGKATAIGAWHNTGGQRLDMQIFELPSSFDGQTLTSVKITDSGDTNVQRAFIAAMTVSTSKP